MFGFAFFSSSMSSHFSTSSIMYKIGKSRRSRVCPEPSRNAVARFMSSSYMPSFT